VIASALPATCPLARRVERQEVFDYGTNCLAIVHREFGAGNAAAASSGVTLTSEQTAVAGHVLISHSDKRPKWVRNEPTFCVARWTC
jgi:hypothetical protein